jgi:hypothetical protein
MNRIRQSVIGLHIGQLIMVTAIMSAVTCGSGYGVLASTDDSGACSRAAGYSDSLASNRNRLLATDSVLRRFDFVQADDPLFRLVRLRAARDSGKTFVEHTADELSRKMVILRLIGAAPPDIRKYLLSTGLPETAASSSTTRQLDQIRALESDSLYRQYVIETAKLDASTLDWHDTAYLTVSRTNWRARCSRFHLLMPASIAGLVVSFAVLFMLWWWWFGGRSAVRG